MSVSKTTADRLGERLRDSSYTETDLLLLDEFRRAYQGAYDCVVESLKRLGLIPTGRPAKSNRSVIAKLNRESTRLSQMQDIGGCRLIVRDILLQDETAARVMGLFPDNSGSAYKPAIRVSSGSYHLSRIRKSDRDSDQK